MHDEQKFGTLRLVCLVVDKIFPCTKSCIPSCYTRLFMFQHPRFSSFAPLSTLCHHLKFTISSGNLCTSHIISIVPWETWSRSLGSFDWVTSLGLPIFQESWDHSDGKFDSNTSRIDYPGEAKLSSLHYQILDSMWWVVCVSDQSRIHRVTLPYVESRVGTFVSNN